MRTLAILTIGLLVAACGGGASSSGVSPSVAPGSAATNQPAATGVEPPAGATLDACALLTDEDILAATGRAVDTMTPGSVMGIFSNGCEWELVPGDDDITPVSIDLGVVSPGGLEYYETYLKFDTTPVSGIGDDAVTDDAGGISAVKGDTLVSVFVIAFGDDEERFTRELTHAALTRVP
jgi:hypothetical protein